MNRQADTFRSLRVSRGWSLTEFARRAGCDIGYLSRIERGERTPSPYFADHLTRVLAEAEDGAA